MHDPLVVAHEVVLPIPVRRWPELGKHKHARFRFERARRMNEENLGEPVYPWWRLKGYELTLFGQRVGLYPLATIWHNEPRGADSGSICKHHDKNHEPLNAWRWHVHHWQIQVHPWQAIRRWLFDRCCVCGFRFRWRTSPITFSWNPKRHAWWAPWRSDGDLMHDHCCELRSLKRDATLDKLVIRGLFDECSLRAGETEQECLHRIYKAWEFAPGYRLLGLIGYEWNEEHTELAKR